MTREIIHIHRKLKRSKRSGHFKSIHHSLKTELASILSEAKAKYFSQSLRSFLKHNPEKFWLYLSEAKKEPNRTSVNNCIIRDTTAIANHFNQYFHSVFKAASEAIQIDYSLPDLPPDFITFEGVLI